MTFFFKIFKIYVAYENRFINETITIDEHHYHPSAPMTRILHKESDILPISHSNYTGLMSSHTPYSHITPSEYKITKRHLALVSNKNDDFRVVDQYSSDHYQQPIHSAPIFLNRKVATSSSRPLGWYHFNLI